MSIKKKLAVAGLAVAVFSLSALAQDAAPEVAAEQEVVSESAAEEEDEDVPEAPAQVAQEVAPPTYIPEPAASEPAPAPVAVAESKPASKFEVTPYGAAQYRLRFELGSMMPDSGDGASTFDYSNRLSWRLGLKMKYDDQFSMQFQVGNHWGSAENVGWGSNLNGGNLYAHLAFFRWDPGAIFLEAGIVPLNGHGALDLIERSGDRVTGTMGPSGVVHGGRYAGAIYHGWGEMNSSLVGIKLGVPIVTEGVKIGAELTQSVTAARTQNTSVLNSDGDPMANPSGIMTVLQIPVEAGAFKITPEAVFVFNKDLDTVKGDRVGDHEMGFGGAGSFKISDGVAITFRGGYAMYSDDARTDGNATTEESGFLVGAGTSIKAGPGTLQLAVDFNGRDDAKVANDAAAYNYLYTDLRYGIKLHPRVTFTPRYRTYTIMYPNDDTWLRNRFELIVEGSF